MTQPNQDAGEELLRRLEAAIELIGVVDLFVEARDEIRRLQSIVEKLGVLIEADAEPVDDTTPCCARCGETVSVDDESDFDNGHDFCHDCAQAVLSGLRFILLAAAAPGEGK